MTYLSLLNLILPVYTDMKIVLSFGGGGSSLIEDPETDMFSLIFKRYIPLFMIGYITTLNKNEAYLLPIPDSSPLQIIKQ